MVDENNEQEDPYAAPEAELAPEELKLERGVGAAPGAPAEFGPAFQTVWTLGSESFVPLLLVAALWGMTSSVNAIIPDMPGYSLIVFGCSLASVYLWATGLKSIDKIFRGQPVGDEFSLSAMTYLKVLGSFVVLMVAYLGAFAVGSGPFFVLGFLTESAIIMMLAMFPGAALATIISMMLIYANVAIVVEDRGVFDAVKRSFTLVNTIPSWFYSAGLIMIVGSCISIPVVIVSVVIAGMAGLDPEAAGGGQVILVVTFSILYAAIYPFALSATYVVFQSLVARKEGWADDDEIEDDGEARDAPVPGADGIS